MERSRRVVVRSIYARNNEDGDTSNHEDSNDKTSSVVGGAPRTTSSPRTRAGTSTPSPSKRVSISEDASTTKKRSAESSNLTPPVKRGRGRPPGSGHSQASVAEVVPKEEDGEPRLFDDVVPKEEDDEAPLSVVSSPARSTRRAPHATHVPPVYLEQPILDAQEEVHGMMVEGEEEEHMQDLVGLHEEVPPSLDLCGQQEGEVYGPRSGLLGAALAKNRGRPINSTSRKSYKAASQSRASAGREMTEAEAAVAMMEDEQEEEELMEEDSMMDDRSQERDESRVAHNLYNHHRDSHRYVFNPDTLSDFYESDMTETEMGDKFLKAREGTLPSLLKREMILSLIVNDTERVEKNEWVNSHPPAIPPLTSKVATYICFVDTKTIEDAKLLTTDGLSPWSRSHPTLMRPKVRKWAVYMRGGEYCISGEDWRMSLYVLVEYSALLPRAPRLRKRVYYMTRDKALLGLAMLIYDYIEPGPIPAIVAHCQGMKEPVVVGCRYKAAAGGGASRRSHIAIRGSAECRSRTRTPTPSTGAVYTLQELILDGGGGERAICHLTSMAV